MSVDDSKLLLHNDILGHFKTDVGFGELNMRLERCKMLISIFSNGTKATTFWTKYLKRNVCRRVSLLVKLQVFNTSFDTVTFAH